ncbi:exodeoxyribonuclease VII large subunit [Brevibacillus laterosporus]|uniref:exodeoxyribonuclease VII large subunit n=1 Tax=Brevibacillus laterosporus TaxID=1465 RepID=UPI0018CE3BA0|nr:exodeoxyribonuclease VII large subunit [Brevibacillus laterosporus]MBG9774291.1 exodeoxyribonuclease VII large subunit [Brevibacillus laterosporus]MBG9796534.1 exodeoxyribonuclease VII large subunit [Brevibacillus laterosporus]MCR8938713.1 exodeoxyribonuclease VII large subunit [Brevibacillus laterosporus]MCZ0841353.1 exodeoxyribonuclease VII large subunit [Brevibacillus laterosporus]MCZ0847548.1 exodeoxyribonuclease VII large subunit [Brevibacillus laterosporus]
MKPAEVMSVAELNRYVKRMMEGDLRLADVWIRGEISNFTHHHSGHMYFTLKDKDSRLKIVMFASYNRFLTFIPKNGTKAIVRGSISVFERDGAYQLYARELQPDGIGALFLAYEQLKEKLQQEGLFASERKRALPRFPKTIGVVTSPTGAAIRDIITTLKRRYPQAGIMLAPAIVQGVEAPASIIRAIRNMNQYQVDVMIVGRGGGSIEELWAFNDEAVARAIVASQVPVISAVGHETDFTIADFVADMRAATPTAAAELAVPHYLEWMERIKQLDHRLARALQTQLQEKRTHLQRLQQSYGLKNPLRRVEERRQRIDEVTLRLSAIMKMKVVRKREQVRHVKQRLKQIRLERQVEEKRVQINRMQSQLTQNMKQKTERSRQAWLALVQHLDALSPLKVMQRGFSLSYKGDTLIKSVEGIEVGDQLMIRYQDGKIMTTVTDIERKEENHGS